MTGTSRRLDNRAGDGPCDGPPDVIREVENRIGTALVASADDVSIIADATWMQRRYAEPRLTGDPAVSPCVYTDTLTFEDEASVVSTLFGERVATFAKRGEIVRDRREGSASEGSARLDAGSGTEHREGCTRSMPVHFSDVGSAVGRTARPVCLASRSVSDEPASIAVIRCTSVLARALFQV